VEVAAAAAAAAAERPANGSGSDAGSAPQLGGARSILLRRSLM